jgi:WD40 repeat protein
VVEDVAWHCSHPTIFGSCGEDKKLIIWDLRSPQPQKWSEPHTAEVNCVAFNPMEEWLLATGSADRSVVLHDMRMLHQRLHVMDAHREEVFQVPPLFMNFHCHNFFPIIFASAVLVHASSASAASHLNARDTQVSMALLSCAIMPCVKHT